MKNRRKKPPRLIDISVGEQRLRLRQGGKILMTCVISTSKSGLGTAPGSNKTPTGSFRVAERHGQGAPRGTIFKSRQPVGVWSDDHPVAGADDLITSRLLWLEGLEKQNANTYERYIYIHGTNHEHRLGTPASHGCIRMSNEDVIKLFELAPEGTEVTIG
jgi:lipoprotein-anchoring transpeptidase ErfK/SrfK